MTNGMAHCHISFLGASHFYVGLVIGDPLKINKIELIEK